MKLERIAEGRTAEVFALTDSKVVKLYRDGYPPDEAEREARKADLAHKQNLPTPQVVDLVEMEGRNGIVFETCLGPTMYDRLRQHPNDAESMGRLLADSHAEVHECSGAGLVTTVQRLRANIERAEPLDDELRMSLQNRLSAMPCGESLCHGDFHPKNVILSKRGPVIIDWVDATMGPPSADVVRTILLLRSGKDPLNANEAEICRRMRTTLLRAYQEQYLALRSLPARDLQLWMPIVAGARLSENIACAAAEDDLVALARTV